MQYGGAEGIGGAQPHFHGHHHQPATKSLGQIASHLQEAEKSHDKKAIDAAVREARTELGHKLNDHTLTATERKAVQQALTDLNKGHVDKVIAELHHLGKK